MALSTSVPLADTLPETGWLLYRWAGGLPYPEIEKPGLGGNTEFGWLGHTSEWRPGSSLQGETRSCLSVSALTRGFTTESHMGPGGIDLGAV